MKYWVYKESRILGPFDKESMSGLPGLDSGTLVCEGDPAGGAWVPAGELDGLTRTFASVPLDELATGIGLLDQLQIDSAGLVDDDEFPGSFAEELFQDAALKKGFGDVLSARAPADDAEARRARDKISELTAQLEAMYRHISELEAGQTDLALRLAAKDLQLRSTAAAPAGQAAPAPVKTFLSPAPAPVAGGPPPVAAVPEAASVPSDWPEAPPAGSFPSFAGGPPAAAPEKAKAPEFGLPSSPALPAIPNFAAAFAAPAPDAPPSPPSVPADAPIPLAFGKPKSFKIVPAVRSFKVLGADDAPPVASENTIEFKLEPIEAAAPIAAPAPAPIPLPTPAPIALAPIMPPPPPTPEPVKLAPVPVPAPVAAAPAPEAVPFVNPFALPVRPTVPPNTMSRPQPVPDLTSGDLIGSGDATSQVPPPATMARSAGAGAAVDDGAAQRFAKPEPPPPTGEIKKPARSNKPFLIGGVVLVSLLAVLGLIFMRQPKDDLKQMTTLDDGKAPIGLPADDGTASAPPIVKPKIAAPPAAPAPPPGPSAEHLAAISNVKDFPLDGGRGTVGRWLQYSYTASPNAGAEEWNASTTAENTVLVEYRLVPGASGGKGALYLFEVDSNGLVMGKNIEARQMLAGGPPPDAPTPKKKAVKKTSKKHAPKRRAYEEPKEVPLLPLPDSGELRPPAEDDGSFGSDTINSGI